MLSPKVRRRLLWIAGTPLVILLVLYLLRWPLLGGTIRAELERAITAQLPGTLEIGTLGGSLVSGATARDIVLRPLPETGVASITLDSVEARYGLFGSGDLEVRAEGARIELARGDGSTPLHKSIRDGFDTRSIRLPGRFRVRNVTLVIPDTRTITFDEADLDRTGGTVRLRTEGFGLVEAMLKLDAADAADITVRASEGPIPDAHVTLGPAADGRQPLRVVGTLEGHEIDWSGEAIYQDGRLARARGELKVKEGRASTEVNLATGTAVLDFDARIAVEKEIRTEAALKGRATGPIEGPLEAWTFSDATIRTGAFAWKDLEVDAVEVDITRGSAAELPLHARVRRGDDRAEAIGIFRWRDEAPEIEASVDVTAADAAPYLALVPDAPPVRASKVRAIGRIVYGKDGIRYDGAFEAAAGAFDLTKWESIRADGVFSEHAVKVRSITLEGLPIGGTVTASGGYRDGKITLTARTPNDLVTFEGNYTDAHHYRGTIDVRGAGVWLKALDITLPESARPLTIQGSLSRTDAILRLEADLVAGTRGSASPRLSGRRIRETWHVDVEPGIIRLPNGPEIRHGTLGLQVTAGTATLSETEVEIKDQDIAGALTGSAKWDARAITVDLLGGAVRTGELRDGKVSATVDIERATGDLWVNLLAEPGDGSSVHLGGTFGASRDLSLTAGLRLDSPILRRFVPETLKLRGGATAMLRLEGRADAPKLTGLVTLRKVSAIDLAPLDLVIPVKTEDGEISARFTAEETPYGILEMDARVPVPKAGAERRIDATARLETADIEPLLTLLPEEVRPWIPRGRLTASASVSGPVSEPDFSARAAYAAPRLDLPAPVAPITGIVAEVTADRDGLRLDRLAGTMGGGTFHGTGWWALATEGRPLKVDVSGTDLMVVQDPLARMRIDPKVTLSHVEGKKPVLSGEVEVPLVLLYRDLGAGGEKKAQEAAAPKIRLPDADGGGILLPGIAGLEDLQLDLAVRSTGEVRIENATVGALLGGQGRIRGTAAAPAASGKVTVERGEVKLTTGIFIDIDSAHAEFPDQPGQPPTARFEGHSGKGEGQITIVLSGPLDNMEMSLQSNPPRPRDELLALLAFGIGTGDFSGTDALGTLALKLKEQAFDDWPKADRETGFFDTFNPTIRNEGAEESRREPWQLPAGGTARGTVIRTEYIFSRWFSLIAETDREANVSGDLKARLRFP